MALIEVYPIAARAARPRKADPMPTQRFHRRPTATLCCAAALVLLAGCSAYTPRQVQPGMGVDEVTAIMGPPNARHEMPGGGTRLEYPRGPMGYVTYMIDVDPQGRVTGWQQVLTEANFNAIPAGLPVPELLRRLGRPSFVRQVALRPGQVWIYRYDHLQCNWWLVSVDQGRVRDTSYGLDPRCMDHDGNERTMHQ
jgi:hypothetical protein